ncbi:MAG: DUF3379 family protein [Thiotrichales bacterium]|nr:DUF3379 family protein [Thiotrichales bacterium]
MNELEFHNRLLQDPHTLDEPMLAYLKANPEQQKSLKKARDLDSKIAGALKVEAPEGLIERILLKQSYQESSEEAYVQNEQHEQQEQYVEQVEPSFDTTTQITKSKKSAQPARGDKGLSEKTDQGWHSWHYALGGMAASFLVAVMFFGLWQNPGHSHKALSGEAMVAHILEHVEHDPDLMKPQDLALSDKELTKLFAKVGATMQQPIDSMSYAGECDVEGQRGLHIVMQSESGPVTIIVMPGHQIEAMVAFNKSGYTGELVPVKGGLVAIVGNSSEQLALAQSRFFKAVKFG